MKYIKRYLISILISLVLIFSFAFLLNTLNYFNSIKEDYYRFFILVFLIISIFTGSYYLGSKTENKGYQKGIIFGLLISLLFIILTLLFKDTISSSSIIYYIITIITAIIGSTIGINKKTTEINQ
jgi:putative membrane protein (TIGR04086 family)